MKFLRILLLGITGLTSSFAANWTGGFSTPDSTQIMDSRTFYVIQTPEELAWFASEVNGGNTAINGMLANDIVLWEDDFSDETTQWIPIGNEAASAFTGIFNGNGHAISGLYMNDTIENDTVFAGLFGKVGKGGLLENIQVTHASITIHGQT